MNRKIIKRMSINKQRPSLLGYARAKYIKPQNVTQKPIYQIKINVSPLNDIEKKRYKSK